MKLCHPTLARTPPSVNQSDSDEILGPHRVRALAVRLPETEFKLRFAPQYPIWLD